MRKSLIKKILLYTGLFLVFATIVLSVHIYVVTRPKAPTEHTRIMARLDIKQNITQDDAAKITAWLYLQKGIDHVLVNPQSRIVVFTYYPVKTNADVITANFTSNLNYKAIRVIATKDDLASGCPVSNTSVTYKLYNFFKKI